MAAAHSTVATAKVSASGRSDCLALTIHRSQLAAPKAALAWFCVTAAQGNM